MNYPRHKQSGWKKSGECHMRVDGYLYGWWNNRMLINSMYENVGFKARAKTLLTKRETSVITAFTLTN